MINHMVKCAPRIGLLTLLLGALSALWVAGAAAQPGTGPRETVDQRFSRRAQLTDRHQLHGQLSRGRR